MWPIAKGYRVSGYVGFTVVHLAIALTGALLLRCELRTEREASSVAAA